MTRAPLETYGSRGVVPHCAHGARPLLSPRQILEREGAPMRCHSIAAASLLVVLGSAPAALANGAVSEFPAGGVVFKAEKDVSIASEELEIGWKAIRVRYVFVSYATEPIERTIGFPMAKVSLEDGPDNILGR